MTKALLYTKAIKECRQAEEKQFRLKSNSGKYGILSGRKEHYEEVAGEEKLLPGREGLPGR